MFCNCLSASASRYCLLGPDHSSARLLGPIRARLHRQSYLHSARRGDCSPSHSRSSTWQQRARAVCHTLSLPPSGRYLKPYRYYSVRHLSRARRPLVSNPDSAALPCSLPQHQAPPPFPRRPYRPCRPRRARLACSEASPSSATTPTACTCTRLTAPTAHVRTPALDHAPPPTPTRRPCRRSLPLRRRSRSPPLHAPLPPLDGRRSRARARARICRAPRPTRRRFRPSRHRPT